MAHHLTLASFIYRGYKALVRMAHRLTLASKDLTWWHQVLHTHTTQTFHATGHSLLRITNLTVRALHRRQYFEWPLVCWMESMSQVTVSHDETRSHHLAQRGEEVQGAVLRFNDALPSFHEASVRAMQTLPRIYVYTYISAPGERTETHTYTHWTHPNTCIETLLKCREVQKRMQRDSGR